VPNHKVEIASRNLINAKSLERNFDAGLGNFIQLLNSIGTSEKARLIDSLDRLSEEMVAER
jgi:hypothetical protein